MSTDLKTSLLVNQQVPEFVRDEYPTFVAFLEAYYEFLEQKQGTKNNDLITQAKALKNVRDVDESLEEFQQNFYNTYGSLIPLEVQSNKELLFKHLVSLYRSKGNETSIKLLFRLVFGEDIEIVLPKNNVLKPSSSKWTVDSKLRINPIITTRYVADGTTNSFTLAQIVEPTEITVYVDGVESTSFYINKEYRKLLFTTAPTNGSIIEVYYENFNVDLLNNRKVTGLTSGSNAIIELATRRIISDAYNLGLPVELFINVKSLVGEFQNGEYVTIPIIDENGELIDVRASTFSIVKRFNIVDGGLNYKIGDSVLASGGNASVSAIGTVDSIFEGLIDSVRVHAGGAVFSNNSPIAVSGNTAAEFLTVFVDGIDTSGVNAAPSFIVLNDIIGNFNGSIHAANTRIDAVNYNFPNANLAGGENASCRIIDCLSTTTLDVGPITNVKVLYTSIPTTVTPTLDAFGAEYGSNIAPRTTKSLGSIARFKINNPGSNYQIGDEIIFGPNPPMTYGIGAAAQVVSVNATGAIVTIHPVDSRIRGVAAATGTTTLGGTNTFFDQDLRIGDIITVNNESRLVTGIAPGGLSLTVNTAFSTFSNKPIGVYGRYPRGGSNYIQNNFPSVSVSSATGSGANIEIMTIASDGEQLQATGNGNPGAITSIKILVPGAGYQYIPIVSVQSETGTGAQANAEIELSYQVSPGRWTTSDSIISSTERKIQGRDYYVDYSYVISSQTEFYRYKQILKDLLHPVGFVKYADYNKRSELNANNIIVTTLDKRVDEQFLTISGRVNVGNNSVLVVGNSTKFNIAQNNGIIQTGTFISVNGEIRQVNSIVSNTELLTSAKVTEIKIANSGSGYSNGYLVFSNGGGKVTSVDIIYKGSGYANGFVTYTNADQAIVAVATLEVYASNGALRKANLITNGLYSNQPIAIPDSGSHKVLYANTFTITNRGAGYEPGYINFIGGISDTGRVANASYTVFANGAIDTITVHDTGLYVTNPTIAFNTSPNVVVSDVTITNSGLGHSNGTLTFSGGTPVRNAYATVEVWPANGAIRRVTVVDPGLYRTTPTAVPNTYPISVNTISVAADTRMRYANGYITFTGGNPIINANAYVYVYSNGEIQNVTVLNKGLYRSVPTATPNSVPVSVTEVYPIDGGTGYANGYINLAFGGANTVANVSAIVNGTGSIVRTVINKIGLYAIGSNIAVDKIIYANGVTQTGSGATFRIGYNSNTSNIAILTVNTTANGFYTGNVSIIANSNVVTNAVATVFGVPNTQTNAVLSVGFTGVNTAANATVEVYSGNGTVRKIIINSPGEYFYQPTVTPDSGGVGASIIVNSVGVFTQTANLQEMIITQNASGIMTDDYYELTTESGMILTAESIVSRN